MAKKTLVSALYLISSLVLLFSLSSWFFSPVAPVGEYQDLFCNQIYIDTTTGETNSYDEANYGNCVTGGETFDAGDILYKFLVSEADTFEIQFRVTDSANLHVFVMTNTVDSTGADCPDSCLFRLDSTMNLEVALLPGIYWMSVDGMISGTGPGQGEGAYELSVICNNFFEELSCGQIVSGSTVNRVGNYNALNYAGCFDEITDPMDLPDYSSAGDIIYRFEQLELSPSSFTFTLENLDDPDVHMFLLGDVANPNDGSTSPGSCVSLSTSGSGTEEINAILPAGIYYIVIDGVDSAEGGFNLSMICENDYESIACGDLVMGSTSARVNYTNSADYADCAPVGNYDAGDIAYLFELGGEDEVTFTLTPTGGNDLALLLAEAVLDDSTMKYSLGSCIAISDSVDVEKIEMMLDSGSYFVIVDGSVVNDTAEAGPYMLEVKCASLPIELLSFTGVPTKEGIQLDWVTASEIAFEGFHLQRSDDGINWNNLYWQISKGSPESQAEYRYMDKEPLSGANYYRLRSVDLDGTVNISSIIQISYTGKESKAEFSIYPTLTADWLNIRGGEVGKTIQYEIRTPLGYLVKRGTVGQDSQTLDVSDLSAGMMYLTLTDGLRLKTIPFRKL